MKINRIRASMIATLSFFIENIYNRYNVGAMINQHLSPDGIYPQISSSLKLLVLCLVRRDYFVIYQCLFNFSENSFLSLCPLTNATQAFSAL